MDEIPDDIILAAGDIWGSLEIGSDEPAVHVIARAILAERQRCADLAQKEGEGYRDNGLPQAAIGAFQVRRAILNP